MIATATETPVSTESLVNIITVSIGGQAILGVNARELHAYLENGDMFAHWIKDRISKYGFEENQDFALIWGNSQIKGRGGDRRSRDYHLTLDVAKELSMVENNEQGRKARRHFIAMEKKALAADVVQKTTPETRIPLRDAVNKLVGKRHLMYPDAYAIVHERFSVSHIDEIPAAQLPEVIEYIHRLTLEGEHIPAPKPEPVGYVLSDAEALNFYFIKAHFEHVMAFWKIIEPILRQLGADRLASEYDDRFKYTKVAIGCMKRLEAHCLQVYAEQIAAGNVPGMRMCS